MQLSTANTAQLGSVPTLSAAPLQSSRRAFSSGKYLSQKKLRGQSSRLYQRKNTVRAAWRRAPEPESESEDEEAAPLGFNLRGLFGSAAKQQEEKPAAPRGGTRQLSARKPAPRASSQKVSAKPAAPKRGTTKIGVRRPGTQRVGVRRPSMGTQRIGTRRLGGGTTRIGGRAGGTTKIGGRRDTGPRGLFGGKTGRRDEKLVFVAGGTGRLGARIARQLLQQGYKVRVGARDVEKAQSFVDTAVSFGLLSRDAARRVTIVPLDVTDPDTIPAAIGNAAKVVSAIGAAEALNLGAPKKIDGEGAINLVNAAKAVGVQHFVMVTSLGTGKLGWPAAILQLFGGVLTFKRKAEEALEASGLRYTIVRPGGMERPGDDFKETHNVRLAPRDSLFGGQVSRLQVAELIGATIANTSLAENKVLEVVAETDAPRREYELLLADLPTEAAQVDRQATADAIADAEELLEMAREEQQFLRNEAADLQESFPDLYEAQEEAPNARAAQKAERALQQAERQLEMIDEAADQALREQRAAEAVLKAATAAAKQRKSLSAEEVEAIQQSILFPPTEEELAERREAEQRAREEAAEAERAERERIAEEARQEREAAAAEQKRIADEKAAKTKAEAEAKRKAEEDRRKAEQEARAKAEAQEKREAEAKARAEEKAKAEEEAKAERAAEEKARAEAKAKQEAEDKAKREAEEKARKEAEEAQAKKEAEAKKAADEAKAKKEAEEAKAKKEAEAKAKAAQEAKDKKAKEEAQAKAKAEADAKAEAESKAAADAKTKADSKAAAKATDLKDGAEADSAAAAAEQAKKNAAEARAWIDNWRKGAAAQEEEEEAPAEQSGGIFAGFKWPWQQAQQQEEEPAAEEEEQEAPVEEAVEATSETVKDARDWINRWRARTLESKLPSDVKAK